MKRMSLRGKGSHLWSVSSICAIYLISTLFFVQHMEHDHDVSAAVSALNGQELKGRTLNVEVRQ